MVSLLVILLLPAFHREEFEDMICEIFCQLKKALMGFFHIFSRRHP